MVLGFKVLGQARGFKDLEVRGRGSDLQEVKERVSCSRVFPGARLGHCLLLRVQLDFPAQPRRRRCSELRLMTT